ncbi:MAG: S-layer homology domain-containing protein [Clostridia bacterium]|nr:S-layer homology domain-containing protein [Clostridia bacterium]
MKKFRMLFLLLLIISVFAITASAAVYKESLVTTNDSIGISFEIKENVLTVSGMIDKEELQYLAITLDKQYVLPVSTEMKFKTSIDLSAVKNEKIAIGIFLGTELSEPFVSVFYGDDIVLEKQDGKFMFVFDETVLPENEKLMSGWVNEKDHLEIEQPSAVKMITSNVIRGIETDYEKAKAIHRWVAENIYYDENYALKTTNVTPLTPVEVLTERKSVCEGYSNLTVAMLNAAGIPAFVTKGYALGVDGAQRINSWAQAGEDITKPNHAWVEAFVDGRWIVMDPTWDSFNKIYMGEKREEENPLYRYFDISVEMLSLKHLVIERPLTFGKMGISDWAEEEVKGALGEDLILKSMYESMKNKITRKEFCNLVINMLTKKYSKSIEEILIEKNVTLNYSAFVDTTDDNVLSANALGIVNGKENNCFDPEGFITRQEAATMLYRTAKVMGVTNPNSEKLAFTDEEKFADWGKDGIFFVSASLSDKGTRVMGGVEDGKFDPAGYYTKEQSVLTIYRLFHTY